MVLPINVGGISIPFVICASLGPNITLDLSGAVPILNASGGGTGTAPSVGFGLITDSTGKLSVNTAVIQSADNATAGTASYCRSANGTGAYTCSLANHMLMRYTRGQTFVLDADVACSNACTLNVDNVGLRSIKANLDGTTDVPVRAGFSLLVYDGMVMRLLAP